MNLLGWHWLIKLHKFQACNSIIHYLCIALYVHHPKSSLFPSPFTPPLPFATFFHPPFPSGYHHTVVCVYEFFFLSWIPSPSPPAVSSWFESQYSILSVTPARACLLIWSPILSDQGLTSMTSFNHNSSLTPHWGFRLQYRNLREGESTYIQFITIAMEKFIIFWNFGKLSPQSVNIHSVPGIFLMWKGKEGKGEVFGRRRNTNKHSCPLFFITLVLYINLAGVSNLLASLGHTGRRRVVWGHTLNTLRHVITKKSHNVLSKLMISC